MNSFILETVINSANFKLISNDTIEALSVNGRSLISITKIESYQGDFFVVTYEKDGEEVHRETYNEHTDIFALLVKKFEELEGKRKTLVLEEFLRDFTQMTAAELMAKRDAMKCSR